MSVTQSAEEDVVKGPILIRKYPNRRYYSTRESRHVTLQEICDLVREGHDIRVVDSRSGEDITRAVLTRILLEMESPKLAFFPISLLQHLIRMNAGILEDFTENYFQQAFAAFAPVRWAGGGAGLNAPVVSGVEALSELLGPLFSPSSAASAARGENAEDGGVVVGALRAEIEALRRKLERMERAGK